jgi:hypothetical protein
MPATPRLEQIPDASRVYRKKPDRIAADAAIKDSAHWPQCKIYEDGTFHI